MKTGRWLSSYLKAADVTDPQKVTISSVQVEELGRDDAREEKLVVYFKELDQGVVCGKAVIHQLQELCGSDETDDWVGKQVVMFNDRSVTYKGKRVGGIRFREVER